MKRGADKQPSYSSIIEGVLKKADDFMTPRQIVDAHPELAEDLHPWDRTNRVTATLARLRHHLVVDFMVSEGVTYWYITGEDNRARHVEERIREGVGARGGTPVKYIKGRKSKDSKEKAA